MNFQWVWKEIGKFLEQYVGGSHLRTSISLLSDSIVVEIIIIIVIINVKNITRFG